VLGAGAWGTALALLISKTHHVILWSHAADQIDRLKHDGENQRYIPGVRFPATIECTSDLLSTLKRADGVLIVVPSHAFAWATKGLDNLHHRLLSDVVEELTPGKKFAILSGPSFAKEVALGKPTAVTLAHNDEATGLFWQGIMHTDYFRVYTISDYVGAQLAGAVKNVLAVATGMADGLQLGANTQAALITRGLNEMMRLGEPLGARPETFMGLAGVGDLILTCTDNQSRNRRFGKLMGEGVSLNDALNKIDQVVEGIQTAKLIHELALAHKIEMPITQQVYEVLYHHKTVPAAVHDLLARTPKKE
jgi:glycerol-3-phosphate dehydrogenase (NAD(P)+)